MPIQLNPDQEHRVSEALQSGLYQSPAEVIDRALDVLREQEEWLALHREAIHEKISRGLEALDRGEGIPEDQLKEHLRKLKSQQE
jgi:Arc/MetJ-type ribon-helix-helix transcriptional regulator